MGTKIIKSFYDYVVRDIYILRHFIHKTHVFCFFLSYIPRFIYSSKLRHLARLCRVELCDQAGSRSRTTKTKVGGANVFHFRRNSQKEKYYLLI